MLSCSLRSSGSIYSRDEGEWGASSRFLAVYGDQAWVQELAGGGGGGGGGGWGGGGGGGGGMFAG